MAEAGDQYGIAFFSLKIKLNLDYTYSTCYTSFARRKNMKDKDLIKLLKKNGWSVVRINGSHHVLQKYGKTIVVPLHGKDVPVGLLNNILKEAGLK